MPLAADKPTPLQLRTELEEMVLKDLLGPAGGPTEIVTERNVRGRYVLGLLAPKGQTALPDDDDELTQSGTDTEDGKAEAAPLKAATMLPSSIGLTFTVGKEAQALRLTARWGRYDRVTLPLSAPGGDEEGPVWQRTPIAGVSDPIPLKQGRMKVWSPSPDYPDVVVQGLMRERDHQWSITLFLINGQTEPAHNKDSAWLFQPELIVESANGEAIFRKRAQWRDPLKADLEDQATQMLYRQTMEFAVGHGVAVHADRAPDCWDCAVRLSTSIAPAYEVPKTTPPTSNEIPAFKSLVLDMQTLSELRDAEFAGALAPLVTAYATWIDDQAARVANPTDDLRPFDLPAHTAIDHCRKTLDRLRAGVELLGRNPQAAQAFRFANRTMWQQRVHSIYAREIRQGKTITLDEVDTPANRTWYPFQLAFVLINLPALTDPLHPDRAETHDAIADVLWFPTGGGKTEAYLGLTAYTLGIRRLQGDIAGYSGRGGVAVLMRYTLRLLTLQQFQRATALICACELIRREDPATWGDEPFRIGLWVGQRSTPNRTEDAAEMLKQDHGFAPTLGGRGTPYQLTNCPWCGAPLRPDHLKAIPWKKGAGRTFTYCGDKLGHCPFTERQAPAEGLPVIVVDEEIYRRLPALVIATVDKFAQLPWKGETQMLFGKVTGYCPRHGYRSPEIEDSDTHNALGNYEKTKTIPIGPLRPPDLIIQDELHLISGPLGTLVGLYETVVDQLASWSIDGQMVRPKVIASSATIRKAPDQVHSLYVRRASIFPPSGLDAADNFFARQRQPDEANPGRRYLGICAPGQRLRTVLIRVYVAYLSAAQALYEQYGKEVDPYMTLVGYFNSMRELGGMRRAVEDAVSSRVRKMRDRGLANRFTDSIEELTSRKSAADIPLILDRLEAVFDPVRAEERKQKRKAGEATDYAQHPIDVLLATNMISVGVDVPRLGLMVVAGQPKTTAEYIQATSRIGRRYPGLVCVVYNWARPRDLSHYERFEHYHATFFQHVEALSITPYSSRAIERGLTALLVASVRLSGKDFNQNIKAGQISRTHPTVQNALKAISRRAGLVTSRSDVEAQVQQELDDRLDQWLNRAQATTGGARLGYKQGTDGQTLGLLHSPASTGWDDFTCLNSLRDVEPGINLILKDHGMDREPDQAAADTPNEGQT
jgi:hypothetical protein